MGLGEGAACGPGVEICAPIAATIEADALGIAASDAAASWVDKLYSEPSSPGNMQRQVEKGQAPNSVDRVDKGDPNNPGDKEPHIHFKDKSALTQSGAWKHGGRDLTAAERKWITGNNWKVPPSGGGSTW